MNIHKVGSLSKYEIPEGEGSAIKEETVLELRKFENELLEELCTEISMGASVSGACAKLGIDYRKLQRWRDSVEGGLLRSKLLCALGTATCQAEQDVHLRQPATWLSKMTKEIPHSPWADQDEPPSNNEADQELIDNRPTQQDMLSAFKEARALGYDLNQLVDEADQMWINDESASDRPDSRVPSDGGVGTARGTQIEGTALGNPLGTTERVPASDITGYAEPIAPGAVDFEGTHQHVNGSHIDFGTNDTPPIYNLDASPNHIHALDATPKDLSGKKKDGFNLERISGNLSDLTNLGIDSGKKLGRITRIEVNDFMKQINSYPDTD